MSDSIILLKINKIKNHQYYTYNKNNSKDSFKYILLIF